MTSPVLIMARASLREALRKRLVLLGAAVALAFLALYAVAYHFGAGNAGPLDTPAARILEQRSEDIFFLLGLYAANVLTVLVVIMSSMDTLAGDIANGAMQTLVSKPVARWQVLAGKWLGLLGMLMGFEALLVGGVFLIAGQYTGGIPAGWWAAAGLLWLELVLLLSLTLLWSTRLPTLAAGVLSLGFFSLAFLGGWIEQIGSVTHHRGAVLAGILASLIMPSEALWRRAAWHVQAPMISLPGMNPFSTLSLPSGMMVAYAGVYTAVVTGLGIWSFQRRDL